ncbi:MAG: DUF177 domain-containing protein [Ruminococcus sp.]|nr:DUF177 domain-containing protein [Ruminococcus sp.]
MKINLKQLFNIVGESKDISYSIGTEEVSDIKSYTFITPVALNGRIFNRAGIVYLEYTVDFTLSVACDRCLKEFETTYSFDFSHIVVSSLNGDNDDYIVADGESIELNEIAVTDLLLQLPTKNLCREDCKGLCMVCGCDLNESQCNCLNSEL